MHEKWDSNNVIRGTKCFSPQNNGYPGGYPVGFLNWVRANGWSGDKRLHVPCGKVDDEDSMRVDIKDSSNATHVFAARFEENFPEEWSERFNCIMIDPPYSRELAEKLYDTEEYYSSINAFVNACLFTLEPGGLLVTLSYEVPKRPQGCDLIACFGIYQAISVSHMRCFQVWKKKGDPRAQGLNRWIDTENC